MAMRQFGLLCLAAVLVGPVPAAAQEQPKPQFRECLVAPTYDCLVAGARAAAESERDRSEQAILFAYLAGAQAAAGRREDAAATLERAFACAPSTSGDLWRNSFARQVVWVKAQLGETEEAALLAAHVETPYYSAFAYSALAEGQALNGDLDGAGRSLRMSEFAAGQHKDWPDGYVWAYQARAFAFAGQPDRAHELAARTRDEKTKDSGHPWAAYAPAAAAVAEAIAGHGEDYAAYIAEARVKEAALETPGVRAVLLGFISWAHAEHGDRDAMLAAIREIAALDLDKMPAGRKSNAMAIAAMAMGRIELR